MSKTVDILCFRTAPEVIAALPDRISDVDLTGILQPHLALKWRPDLEELTATETGYPEHIQIIPYIVVRYGDHVCHYARPASGGDSRLHGKLTIGVGGHVDAEDVVQTEAGIDLAETLLIAARREIKEEINVDIEDDQLRPLGSIYLQDTPVDMVHLAFVSVIDLTNEQYSQFQSQADELENVVFAHPGDLLAVIPHGADPVAWHFENWTKVILDAGLIAAALQES